MMSWGWSRKTSLRRCDSVETKLGSGGRVDFIQAIKEQDSYYNHEE